MNVNSIELQNVENEEFCLIRKSDGARIIDRLVLSCDKKGGISTSPVYAVKGENKKLAHAVRRLLDAEKRGHVSFGKGI